MRTILGGWISILLGLIGLWVTFNPDITKFSIFQIVLLTFTVMGIVFMKFWDIYSYLKSKPKLYRTTKEIDKYMYDWISRRGRVLIFTRDMSWATSIEIKKLLMDEIGEWYPPKKRYFFNSRPTDQDYPFLAFNFDFLYFQSKFFNTKIVNSLRSLFMTDP